MLIKFFSKRIDFEKNKVYNLCMELTVEKCPSDFKEGNRMSKTKKVLALVLAVMMLVTMTSFPAFAAEPAKIDWSKATITAEEGWAKDDGKTKSDPNLAIDGDLDTHLVSYSYINNGGTEDRPTYTFEIELLGAGSYDLSKLNLSFGGKKWGQSIPNKVEVYFAGEDQQYHETPDVTEADLWNRAAQQKQTPDSVFDVENYTFAYGKDTKYNIDTCHATLTSAVDVKNVKFVKIVLTGTIGRTVVREFELFGKYNPKDPVNYTIRYMDENGNDMIPPITGVNENGETVSATAKTAADDKVFEGMELVSEETQSIKLDKTKTNEIVFNYKKPSPIDYTISYVDGQGNKLADDVKKTAVYPYEVTESPKVFNGYFIPATVSKKITAEDKTIVFTYYRNMTDEPSVIRVASSKVNASTAGGSLENLYDSDTLKGWRTNNWSVAFNNGANHITLDFTFAYPANLTDLSIFWACQAKGATYWTAHDIIGDNHLDGSTRASEYEVYASESDTADYELVYTFNGNSDTNLDEISLSGKLAKRVKIKLLRQKDTGQVGIREITFKGYTRCDTVSDPGDFNLLYKSGTKELKFPMTVRTLDNVSPEADFAASKWSITGGTITSVTCAPSANTIPDCYTWDVLVTVAPNNGADVMMDLTLPASYLTTPTLSYTRTAAEDQFDTSIMDGENSITFNLKNIRNITVDGTKFDTVEAYIRTQVPKAGATYNGYTDLSLEVLSVDNDGNIFSNDVFKMGIDKFMKVEDGYYVANVPYKKNTDGVDRLRAVIVLYGKNAKGEKVEIDRVTVVSETVETSYVAPVEQTDAQKMKDHTTIFDILDQLYAQAASYDLPKLTDADWDFYIQLLKVRETKDADKIIAKDDKGNYSGTAYDAYREAKEADKAATTKDLVLDLPSGKSGVSTYYCWNYLKNMHADSITFIAHGIQAIPSGITAYPEYYFSNDWTTYSITIKSEDYSRLNYDGGATYFKLDMKPLINFDNNAVDSAAAYNSILRSFGSNQIVPLIFRLDWAPWTGGKISTPFDKATINVSLPSGWIENYGNREIAVYRTGDYKRSEDNDVTLTLVSDNLAPDVAYDSATNTYTHTLHFEVPANKLWDTYAIINTSKITNSAPSIIGGSEVKDVPVTGGDLAE